MVLVGPDLSGRGVTQQGVYALPHSRQPVISCLGGLVGLDLQSLVGR